MAAITAAVVAGSATVYGAKTSADAAKDAARAQGNAAQLGVDEQRRQFDTFQQNIQPYLGIGNDATSRLSQLLSGDMSGFQEDPGYQFRLDQGLQAQDRSAAARGGLFSGGHQADLINYGQGMASQEYGNYWNRLMGLANLGQNSAVGAGNLGQQSASNIGNLYGQMGQAQGNSAINQANAWGNAASGLAGIAGNYMGQRSSSYQQPQGQWGAFTPQGWNSGQLGSNYGSGTLGPSNGSTWNFGP